MAKKSRSKIGFDPLAWMKQGSETEPEQEAAATPTVSDAEQDGQIVNGDSVIQDADATKASSNNVVQAKASNKAEITDASYESDEPLVEESAKETIISCGVNIEFADTDVLYQELHRALAHKLPVKIDAGQVKSIHAAAIQLLAVFMGEADRCGIDIEWQNLSDSMRHAVSIIGFFDILPAPDAV